MVEPSKNFKSITEERDHYKELAIKLEKKFQDTKLDLEEYQESSKELEAELESQLVQIETQNHELKVLVNRLQGECESLKEKLQKGQHDSLHQVLELEQEMSIVKAERDDMQKYIRELEQTNDDLERAKRAAVSSLEDFEARLNQAIERNAFLESELDEKETLQITVQRLKDESRDLRHEIAVHRTSKPVYDRNNSIENSQKLHRMSIDSNKLRTDLEESNLSHLKSYNHLEPSNVLPLTPSTRINALNIVGDLLRKVGALESKLASCRVYVKDLSPEKEDVTSEFRTRRLSKGSPLPSPHEVTPRMP